MYVPPFVYTMNSDFQHRSSRQCHIKQDDFHSEFSVISSVQQWCSACRFCVSCRFTLSNKLYLSLLRVCWSIPFPLHHHTPANSRRFCHVATLSQSYSASCVMVSLFQHGIQLCLHWIPTVVSLPEKVMCLALTSGRMIF